MKFLFFSPFQAIERHAFPESTFAMQLRSQGHEVIYCGCDTMFAEFCISQSAYGLNENSAAEEKAKVCLVCRRNRKQMAKAFPEFLLLDQFYDRAQDAEIENAVLSLDPANIYGAKFHSYDSGQLAAYEFILGNKILDMQKLTEEQFHKFQIYYGNTLKAIVAFEKLLLKHKVDKVLVYNSAYSLNNAICAVAKRHDVLSNFMHMGLNLKHSMNSMYFSPNSLLGFTRDTIRYFVENRHKIALDYSKYVFPLDHLNEVLQANSVFTYSSRRSRDPKVLAERLGLQKNYRKVVLLAMSSSDETYGSDFATMKFTYVNGAFRIFADQVLWIQEVIEFFKKHPDCLLIIRIHPREYPNKRENICSPKIAEYERAFANLPDNVVLDHPKQGNSVYDIFDLVDLQLTGQATTGVEGTMLGVPLVSYITGMGMYPIQAVGVVPQTKAEYFAEIEKHLDGPSLHSVEAIRATLEWYLFLYTELYFNFSTSGYWEKFAGRGFAFRVLRKLRSWLGLPRFSHRTYQKYARMPAAEADTFVRFLASRDSREEVLAYRNLIREKSKVELMAERKYFFTYLVRLFESYYGFDLNCYSKFRVLRAGDKIPEPSAGECIFFFSKERYEFNLESKADGALLHIPEVSRLGRAFAGFIQEYQIS